jgi:hypothetical protein
MWFAVTFEARGSYWSATKTINVSGDDVVSAVLRACEIWPLHDEVHASADSLSIKTRVIERPDSGTGP